MWQFVLWEWDVTGRLGFYVFLLTNAEKVWQNESKGWLFFTSLSNDSFEWVRVTNWHGILQGRYNLGVCRQDMIRPEFKHCAWKRGTQKRGLNSFPWNRHPNLGYCIWYLVLQWIWITAPFRRFYNFTRFLEGLRGSCNNKAWSKSKSTDVNWPEIQLRHHLHPVFRQEASAVKHISFRTTPVGISSS